MSGADRLINSVPSTVTLRRRNVSVEPCRACGCGPLFRLFSAAAVSTLRGPSQARRRVSGGRATTAKNGCSGANARLSQQATAPPHLLSGRRSLGPCASLPRQARSNIFSTGTTRLRRDPGLEPAPFLNGWIAGRSNYGRQKGVRPAPLRYPVGGGRCGNSKTGRHRGRRPERRGLCHCGSLDSLDAEEAQVVTGPLSGSVWSDQCFVSSPRPGPCTDVAASGNRPAPESP